MRWRKGETRALNTAEGKKRKSKYCPVSFLLFLSFTLWKNHHGDVMGEHAEAQPSGGVDVFGEVLVCFQVHLTHCPVGPCCRLAVAFSLLLLLLQLEVCRTFRLAGGGQRLVDGRLEAAHMLHGGTVCLHRLHVLVQDGKNLIVQDLVFPDPVCHLLQGLEKDRGM